MLRLPRSIQRKEERGKEKLSLKDFNIPTIYDPHSERSKIEKKSEVSIALISPRSAIRIEESAKRKGKVNS